MDTFYDRKRVELFSSTTQVSYNLDRDRHSRGQSIADSNVQFKVSTIIVLTPLPVKYYCFIITLQGEQAEYGHTYTVNSESSDQQYTVHISASQCTQGEKCIPHCMQGKCSYLCRHMISCSCYDYSHGHLCKHTHKVQTVHQDHIKGQASSDDITSGMLLNVVHIQHVRM